MFIVQVKVKVQGDGLTWEQRPVVGEFMVNRVEGRNGLVLRHNMSGLSLTEKVQQIASAYTGAVEARWNFKENLQGNYVDVKGIVPGMSYTVESEEFPVTVLEAGAVESKVENRNGDRYWLDNSAFMGGS